jgi:hypothetical protein
VKLPANKEPRRTVDVRRGWRGSLSLPPPGGNGLDCYNTIRTHETDASVVSAAIKCQAEVAGTASSRGRGAGAARGSLGRRQAYRRGCRREGASGPVRPELLRAMFDVGYFPPNTPPA